MARQKSRISESRLDQREAATARGRGRTAGRSFGRGRSAGRSLGVGRLGRRPQRRRWGDIDPIVGETLVEPGPLAAPVAVPVAEPVAGSGWSEAPDSTGWGTEW